MEFRIAKPEDFKFIDEHPLYPDQVDKKPLEKIDYDFVLDHGDYILGAGGFRLINDHTAWVWVMMTEYVGNHLVPSVRVIKEWMEGYYDKEKNWNPGFCVEHSVYRLQASVAVNFQQGNNIARMLGFEKESKMLNFFGKGKDAWLYVRFMEAKQ
jgi:hypothetical protein